MITRIYLVALSAGLYTAALTNCSSDKKTDSVKEAVETPEKSAYLERANQYAKDGLLREATEMYQKVLAEDPKNSLAQRNLGIVYVRAGNYKAAVKHLEAVAGKFEDDFDSNFYLAEAYRGVEKYAESIYRYQKSLRIHPEETRAMKSLAWSYFKIRYYSEALQIAKQLKKTAPNDGQVAIILARTLLKLQQPDAAMMALQQGKRSAPADALPYFYSVEGDILIGKGDCDKASKVYRMALKDQPLLAGSLLGLGRCFMQQNDAEKAITYLERALRLRPDTTEAMFLLGKAYETKDKKKSLRYYLAFRKNAAKDPEFLSQIPDVTKKISAMRSVSRQRNSF